MDRQHTGSPPLQFELDAITAHTRSLVSPERLAHAERMVQALQHSGLAHRLLSPGTPAPSFSLQSATGKTVRSADLLAVGRLVVKFFRGRWDPYDMTELETWQALLPELRERGSLLVGISPQSSRQNAFTAERHKLTFPLLSDPGAQLAEQFGIAYTVNEDDRRYFRSILVNLPFLHGDQLWRLPLPATLLLDQAGAVVFAEAHADHRIRPEPQTVIAALRREPPAR